MISLRAAGSIAGLGLAGVSWVRSWWFTNSGSQLAVHGLRFAVHGQAASPGLAWFWVRIHLLVGTRFRISPTLLFRFHIQVATAPFFSGRAWVQKTSSLSDNFRTNAPIARNGTKALIPHLPSPRKRIMNHSLPKQLGGRGRRWGHCGACGCAQHRRSN